MVYVDSTKCGTIAVESTDQWVVVSCELQGKSVRIEKATSSSRNLKFCGLKVHGYQSGAIYSAAGPGTRIDVDHSGDLYVLNSYTKIHKRPLSVGNNPDGNWSVLPGTASDMAISGGKLWKRGAPKSAAPNAATVDLWSGDITAWDAGRDQTEKWVDKQLLPLDAEAVANGKSRTISVGGSNHVWVVDNNELKHVLDNGTWKSVPVEKALKVAISSRKPNAEEPLWDVYFITEATVDGQGSSIKKLITSEPLAWETMKETPKYPVIIKVDNAGKPWVVDIFG